MILSMTGFGRASLRLASLGFDIEVRSVNHRHLDTRVRVPRILSICEADLRARIQQRIGRGKIDLTIVYREGHRFKADEDRNRDGRMDAWTFYGLVGGFETVIRIELDQKGRGYADTFETFEAQDGKAVLARREEDIDGDGEIDMISIYRLGKLVRREILKPEVVAL